MNAKKMLAVLMLSGTVGALTGLPAHAAVKATASEPVDVVLSISDAYVPSGFDSGSDAYVVVNGLFPNTCYQWKNAVVSHVSPVQHEIRSVGTVTQGMCLMMLVPFMEEVSLGKLEKGSHSLRFVNGDGTWIEKRMTIE